MESFFEKLKEVFEKIPIKARFLKDLGFNISYSGFRYFMQGRKNIPSKKLLDNLCSNMEYEYIMIPIKKDPSGLDAKIKLQEVFFKDLDKYLEKYASDPARVYSKEFGKESSVATAIAAFAADEAFDPNERIDMSDLF